MATINISICIRVFIALVVVSCWSCNSRKPEGEKSYEVARENIEQEPVKSYKCERLIDNIEKDKLIELTNELSTTTVLPFENIKRFSAFKKSSGIFGHYSLFYRDSTSIHELGELIIFTPENATEWHKFSHKEEILSITLKDPKFRIEKYLYVGINIREVSKFIKPLKKISDSSFEYQSDCERLFIEINADSIITKLTLEKKF